VALDGSGRLLLFGALVCAAGYSLVGRPRRAAASTGPRGRMNEPNKPNSTNTRSASPPSVEQWGTHLAPGCLAHGIPLAYALKWIDLESGGNPCAIGSPASRGPDGNPRELGIAQFYNPDDLRRFGVTGTQLRAYCVPGDNHAVTYKGRTVRGFSSALLRPLTATEMQEQADAAVKLIAYCMSTATRDLRAVNAGATWSPATRNFWTMVKLQHGLPGLSRSGLRAVARRLGRAPRSWEEFKATIGEVELDRETTKYRDVFPAILRNAERCASVFAEPELA
jgi:hypothetical protein